MNILSHARRAASIVAFALATPVAFGAAPDTLAPEDMAPAASGSGSLIDYSLDTEMVVHNWVLCISQPFAEQLARAREAGEESARTAYADLAGARSCGQYPELRLILQERLYAPAAGSLADARVFGALVNLSGDWASAFVVSDVLADE